MTNATIEKFGYPASLVHEYEHWVVLLRPKQATLGALVLACKSDATEFAAIGPDAFTELATVTRDMEAASKNLFGYEKINYLMLMMVDPHVHFHVLPRYASDKYFAGLNFTDPAWPGPPNLGFANDMNDEIKTELQAALKQAWTK